MGINKCILRVCQPSHGEKTLWYKSKILMASKIKEEKRSFPVFLLSLNMEQPIWSTPTFVQSLAFPARQPGGLQLLMASSPLQSEGVLCAGGLEWLRVMEEVEGKWERSKRVMGFELRSETRDLWHKPNKQMHPTPAQDLRY